ncbi:MAG: type III-A CRISPR-associated protein Csm2 [Melioribacteraceae bacterium]|nr:type III-A CRISPR-associated protein Csm2 [Melioribacteraceae bacterium]MCF8414580.1 type III-A CRISPR-associated protein Csm2 [Melioribacteraceae bacterium]
MAKGKITKVIPERFFFIDHDYWCHVNAYKEIPNVGDVVEYQQSQKPDGKKFANNVVFVKGAASKLDDYLEEIEKGYFPDDGKYNLKPSLIINFPKQLAEIFQTSADNNKSAQIRKYFDSCRLIEGRFKLTKDFDYVISELLKLIPLLNNARGKDHVTNEFYDFFEANVNQAIKSENHFLRGFIPHFESLIGFYKH